jgi:hypothetical protein
MNLIGEYSKNSTILLELLTKDEYSMPIPADFPPTAVIEYFDGNGLNEVDRVTLEEIGIGRYLKPYLIPSEWGYGDYLVTYFASLGGIQCTTKERFQLSKAADLLQENRDKLLDILQNIGNPSADGTTLYEQILLIAKGNEQPLTVSDTTILTPSGGFTTVIVNGVPVKGAIVNIWSYDNPGMLVAKATTDSEGRWMTQVYAGKYIFEFVHPNGTVLRTLEKVVS